MKYDKSMCYPFTDENIRKFAREQRQKWLASLAKKNAARK